MTNPENAKLLDRRPQQGIVTIVTSLQDPASQNIAEQLRARHRFPAPKLGTSVVHPSQNIRLVMVDKPCIYVDSRDLPEDHSSIIFASKHVSSTNTPAMTVHATGNLTNSADFGGKPREVSFVDPTTVQRALRSLKLGVADAGLEMDVTMEATHHGPTSFPVSVFFVEIGSGPKEWKDPTLGRIAAGAIMEAASVSPKAAPGAVGFGGTHYSPKFTRMCLEGEYPIGHIVPRHAFESGISDSIIGDVLKKTVGANVVPLIDWKGLMGNDRRKLVSRLEDWGYVVERC